MKVPVSKTDRVQAELDRAQANARERLLNAEQVAAFAARCEAELQKHRIPKKLRQGAWAAVTGGGVTARSYRYVYSTTVARLERGPSAWFVTDAFRESSHANDIGAPSTLSLTDAQIWSIAERHRRIRMDDD